MVALLKSVWSRVRRVVVLVGCWLGVSVTLT